MERLENTTLLHNWGVAKALNDVSFDGPELLHQLNPDILFPLSKTYVDVTEGELSHVLSALTFRHESVQRLAEGAQLAARLMYDSSR